MNQCDMLNFNSNYNTFDRISPNRMCVDYVSAPHRRRTINQTTARKKKYIYLYIG